LGKSIKAPLPGTIAGGFAGSRRPDTKEVLEKEVFFSIIIAELSNAFYNFNT